jgi:hypothetical protein
VTPDAGAQPGGLSPADGSGPRELLRYRSAQGRWVVAAMILGSSVAGIDSTVVAVALPAIGHNLHAGFGGLPWTVTSYTLTLASLILLAGSLSDRWGRRRVFLVGLAGERGDHRIRRADRICLDLLRSARARRKSYVGEWMRAAARTYGMDQRAAGRHYGHHARRTPPSAPVPGHLIVILKPRVTLPPGLVRAKVPAVDMHRVVLW